MKRFVRHFTAGPKPPLPANEKDRMDEFDSRMTIAEQRIKAMRADITRLMEEERREAQRG